QGISSWSSRVFTPSFTGLLLGRLAVLIVASIILFRVFHGSYTIVAFGLSLLLLVIAASASFSTKVRDPIARNLLFCTGIFVLLACLGLQAMPDVQTAFHAITLSQLLSVVLITAAFITLVRAANRFAWLDYATVIAI